MKTWQSIKFTVLQGIYNRYQVIPGGNAVGAWS